MNQPCCEEPFSEYGVSAQGDFVSETLSERLHCIQSTQTYSIAMNLFVFLLTQSADQVGEA